MSQSTSQVLTLHQSEAATPRQYHSAAYLNGKPSNAKQTSSSNLVDPSNSYSQSLSELSVYPNQSANTSIAYQSSKSAMLSQEIRTSSISPTPPTSFPTNNDAYTISQESSTSGDFRDPPTGKAASTQHALYTASLASSVSSMSLSRDRKASYSDSSAFEPDEENDQSGSGQINETFVYTNRSAVGSPSGLRNSIIDVSNVSADDPSTAPSSDESIHTPTETVRNIQRTRSQRHAIHANIAPPRPEAGIEYAAPVGAGHLGGLPSSLHGLPLPEAPFAARTTGRRSRSSSVSSGRPRSGSFGAGTRTSFTLSHGGDAALALYRETAKRTNDPNIQMEFAKYLLDCWKQQTGGDDAEATLQLSKSKRNSTVNASSVSLADLKYQSAVNQSNTSLASNGSALFAMDGRNGNRSPDTSSIAEGFTGYNFTSGPANHQAMLEEAIFWINRLSRNGHPEACELKGYWHQNGLYGMSKSEDKAIALYTTASKQGSARASYRLGEIYERKRSIQKATQYYLRASAQNDALANLRLGKAHLFGELKLQRDYVVAIRYLRRASDAATESDTESHEAPFLLGQLLGDIHPNVRIPPETLLLDPPGALEQFKRAAEMGHPQAMFELAYAYEYACFGLQFPEPDLSIEWYRRAAQLGNAEAMMGLSGWYLTGLEGVLQPDESAAFEWCRRAAEEHQLPKAEYALGYYYEVGVGTEPDMETAIKWYKLAAQHGSKDAKLRLEKNGPKQRKSDYGTIKLKKHKKGRDCVIM